MTNILIKEIKDSDAKDSIVQDVLADLPEWFGLPESTKEYIEESRTLQLWAAMNGEEVVGFITLSASSTDCAEIRCMGVKKKYHRKGVGKSLFQTLENEAKEKYEYIQVKTVDEGHYNEYDQTILFYKNQGFAKLEVFPTLWDERKTCLVLIKKI